MYGIIQAGNILCSLLLKNLAECGFKSSRVDECVYFTLSDSSFIAFWRFVHHLGVVSNLTSVYQVTNFCPAFELTSLVN